MANEKIDKLEKKIQQLKAQKQAIIAREKEKERKARTRRLIQIGALAEKYLDIHSPEDMEQWLKDYKNKKPSPSKDKAHDVNRV
jgi:phage shock protein A